MSINTIMGKDQGESVTIRALETGWDHTRVYLVKQHFCMILTIEPENQFPSQSVRNEHRTSMLDKELLTTMTQTLLKIHSLV